MMKLSSTTSEMKVKIFSGTAEKVEKEMTGFMNEKKVKVHGFAQSQSTIANSFEVNVTATLLYTEFEGPADQKIGFNH